MSSIGRTFREPSALTPDRNIKEGRTKAAPLRQGSTAFKPTLLYPEARGEGRGAYIHVMWAYELWRIHAAKRRVISACLHKMFGRLRVFLLGSYQLAVLHLAMAHQLCQRHVTFIFYVLPDAAPAVRQKPKSSDTHKAMRQSHLSRRPTMGAPVRKSSMASIST